RAVLILCSSRFPHAKRPATRRQRSLFAIVNFATFVLMEAFLESKRPGKAATRSPFSPLGCGTPFKTFLAGNTPIFTRCCKAIAGFGPRGSQRAAERAATSSAR